MEVEDTGSEKDGSEGYREGESWKWRAQGGKEIKVEDTEREWAEVEDTGRERDVGGGYMEGESWKWRVQEGRVRNMEDTGRETVEVEEIGRESEKCGGYREEKGGSGGCREAKVWKWSLQEETVMKDTGREREQDTGEDTGSNWDGYGGYRKGE
jgi:hypothetical protein